MNTDRDNGVWYMLTNVLEEHTVSTENGIWYMTTNILEEHSASIFGEFPPFTAVRTSNLT
jgi:hypothetical protein